MPQVTALKPQKNNKRVNVFLDNKFAFGIDLDNLVKFGVRVERNFSGEEIKKIIYAAEFAKTYNRILNFATIRPRSEKEYFDWLKRKEVPISIHKKLFSKLKHLELLDDNKFAAWWIAQRIAFKKKSKKELTFELLKKGIAKSVIDENLANSDIDEPDAARQLYEKNKYKWQKLETEKQKQKAFEFLARRGFDFETIKSVVKYTSEE